MTMATDKFRIQVYVAPELYQRLIKWKKEQGILHISEALNQVMVEKFGAPSQSLPNPQSLPREQIEEMIEQECSLRIQEIKEHVAAKLPTLTELDSKIDGYVQERMKEQSEDWMIQLGKRFYDRIYALEQKIWTLENAAKPKNQLPESLSERPSELNLSQLARRLGVSKSVVSRRKVASDFEAWSKGKDPEVIAWRYDHKNQKFSPVEDRA